eukprot:7937179-Alexandrium_andersonii.AAC.1
MGPRRLRSSSPACLTIGGRQTGGVQMSLARAPSRARSLSTPRGMPIASAARLPRSSASWGLTSMPSTT